MKASRYGVSTVAAVATVLAASPALATQTHGGPEGLVVHQMAHLFFVFSMGTLAYWLRARGLTARRGWRLIRYAAIMLILWNLDAFVAHLLDEQTALVGVRRIDNFHLELTPRPGFEALAVVYYLVKLDHLLCVPALVFLYLGLRRLVAAPDEPAAAGDAP